MTTDALNYQRVTAAWTAGEVRGAP